MIEFVKIENKDGSRTMEIEKSLLPQYMLRGWKEAKKDKVKVDYSTTDTKPYYNSTATK